MLLEFNKLLTKNNLTGLLSAWLNFLESKEFYILVRTLLMSHTDIAIKITIFNLPVWNTAGKEEGDPLSLAHQVKPDLW